MTKNDKDNKESVKIAGVEITHPSRLLYPDDGITKLDVAKYYEKVEKLILPELKDRPLSLVRAPGGINDGKFFQKHPGENFPNYIERIKIKEKEGSGIYILADQLNDLIYLVNLGVLEFHTWGSKYHDLEHPDIVVFDLDPDVPIGDSNAHPLHQLLIEGAFLLKQKLEKQGYNPKVKTSGNKGFHIMIENFKKHNWDDTKEFAKTIAAEIALEEPDKFTISLPKEDRKGKVFIDYLRNERGSTFVAAYSLRAKPTAPISFPIEWNDIEKFKPDFFNINNFEKYL